MIAALAPGPVAVDTVGFIYFIEEHARFARVIAPLFEEVDRGELKVIPMKDGKIIMGAIDILVNREERLSPSVESFLMMVKEYFNRSLCEINGE